ncbi:hypothetical protein P691DRAFT_775871 [Macrolepiota fuliginosa MF-IS2]|uniref:Protein YOP1 n=1 Tax=Macrolepiota fuliginosa MF-IS2 TaxID=1400762 RepID=A0A9P6C3K0_9AGAR|nr:hypothetical protein P691DRAFT_775871 [Macrolepiota fuliginosa MF-IS2]
MLMSLLSHILCAWFAFLLPSYATFKALSHRPLSEPDLQRWSMYWTVVGAFVAFEYAAEWLISWLPFYWELKTAFLLYLALPQTQASPDSRPGSTYIYTTYLQPLFTQHEADFDEGIVQVQKNVLVFIQSRLTTLWEFILNAANKRQTDASTASGTPSGNGTAPAQAGLQTVLGLWQTYGASITNVFGSRGTPAPTSGTSSSVQDTSAATQRRSAQDINLSAVAGTSGTSAPAFPEPHHFS